VATTTAPGFDVTGVAKPARAGSKPAARSAPRKKAARKRASRASAPKKRAHAQGE
jgi:hypothetical protein